MTSISNINGLIQANGSANLFLLNPSGIIFGPNASLNIGGSFIASTASAVKFAAGTSFSATAPHTAPPLTVSVPVGLQFEANPGRILVRGGGKETTSGGGDTSAGLRAAPAQTLALVGGNVALEGGTLKTAGGRIELGSVAGAGTVSLTPAEKGFSLGYEGVPAFGDIQLSQEASADASGAGGGDVQVTGRRVTLTGGSRIEANTWGSQAGGTLKVQASELVELAGTSADGSVPSAPRNRVSGNFPFPSPRFSEKPGFSPAARPETGFLATSPSHRPDFLRNPVSQKRTGFFHVRRGAFLTHVQAVPCGHIIAFLILVRY